MKQPRNTTAEEGRIVREATEWVIRVDCGLSPEDQDALSGWLASSSLHRTWYAIKSKEWSAMDILADWRPEHSVEPNPDLLAKPNQSIRSWVLPVALSLAACIAVLLTFAYRVTSTPLPGPLTAATIALPETRTLEDGSVVELDAGAEISTAFTVAERRVRLHKGEAQFKVAKNPNRPFVVQVGDVEFLAMGTVFNVKLRERAVEMFVTEGRVSVATPSTAIASDSRPVLAAGQCASVPVNGKNRDITVTVLTPEEIQRRLAWQPRLLDFDSNTLEDVVVEFNRHNSVQIVLVDPSLKSLRLVASFKSDNVDGFVRMLKISEGIEAQRSGDVIALRHPAPSHP
jgi:transmembrane sensor